MSLIKNQWKHRHSCLCYQRHQRFYIFLLDRLFRHHNLDKIPKITVSRVVTALSYTFVSFDILSKLGCFPLRITFAQFNLSFEYSCVKENVILEETMILTINDLSAKVVESLNESNLPLQRIWKFIDEVIGIYIIKILDARNFKRHINDKKEWWKFINHMEILRNWHTSLYNQFQIHNKLNLIHGKFTKIQGELNFLVDFPCIIS